MKIIENPRYIAAIVISIGIAYTSYVYLVDKPNKEQLNHQILKDALEKYVLEGDTNQKDAYGTEMQYYSKYGEKLVTIQVTSAGPSRDFNDDLDNVSIRWITAVEFLDDLPVEDHLKTGGVTYEGFLTNGRVGGITVTYP